MVAQRLFEVSPSASVFKGGETMYKVYKDGELLSIEDKGRFVKMQSNGVMILCPEYEAQGVVVNNQYACHLEGKPLLEGCETVTIEEFDGVGYFDYYNSVSAEIGGE